MDKTICPLLTARSDDFRDFQECIGARCAWWRFVDKHCAILGLSYLIEEGELNVNVRIEEDRRG